MATKPNNRSFDKREFAVFPYLLRTIRMKANVSQKELGEALGHQQQWTSAVEAGSRRLDPLQVREWLTACGVTYAEFGRRVDEAFELLAQTEKPKARKPKK